MSIRQLNKLVYKNLLIPTLISIILGIIGALNNLDWWSVIPAIFTGIIMIPFEFNKDYLLKVEKLEDEIQITRYNYLDKIITESFKKNEIVNFKDTKKYLKIELRKFKVLELYKNKFTNMYD